MAARRAADRDDHAGRSADTQGFSFTPVRSGEEKLRMEYRPVQGEGVAQRVVSYDVTVPERGIFGRMWDAFTGFFWRSNK